MTSRPRLRRMFCVLALAAAHALAGDAAGEPPVVSVARPVEREVDDVAVFTGRAEAAQRVEIRSRAVGYLTSVRFKEGQAVKAGEVLFEIDSRPCEARLIQALAQIELHRATLQAQRAALSRSEALAKSAPGSVSREQIDRDKAAFDEAAARVRVAEAAAEIARLDLSYCRLMAPFSGRIGRTLVDPGNLVDERQTLAVIVSDDPIRVSFQIDERSLLKLMRSARNGDGDRKFPVAVGLADEKDFPRSGVVDFIDNALDPETGTIRIRAVLPKDDAPAIPGMLVRVRLSLGLQKALLVSDRAIRSDGRGRYVQVVDSDDRLQIRRVNLGALQPDGMRAVGRGLAEDDRVVSVPVKNLGPGSTVRAEEGDWEKGAPPSVTPPDEKPK